MPRSILALLLLAVTAGACTGPRDPTARGIDAQPSPLAVEALRDSLAEAPSSVEYRAVLARALARYGLTPYADDLRRQPRFQLAESLVVGGFVPGGSPLVRDELVIVQADAEGPGALALAETGRVLAERARWSNRPGRSVQIVFGASGRLAPALWPRASIHAVVYVGEGVPAGDAFASGGPAGEATTERIPMDGDAVSTARRVLGRVVELASETFLDRPEAE
ncbi:MAG: hypothetical protein AAGK21_01170 [Bacteroidota bacterium]